MFFLRSCQLILCDRLSKAHPSRETACMLLRQALSAPLSDLISVTMICWYVFPTTYCHHLPRVTSSASLESTQTEKNQIKPQVYIINSTTCKMKLDIPRVTKQNPPTICIACRPQYEDLWIRRCVDGKKKDKSLHFLKLMEQNSMLCCNGTSSNNNLAVSHPARRLHGYVEKLR